MIRPFVLNHNTFLRPAGTHQANLDDLLRDIGGNSGNSYITYALSRFTSLDQLEGIASIFVDGAMDIIDVEHVNANFTHVFLVLQDHLRISNGALPWRQLARLLERFRLPVIVFSLGANSFGQTARELAAGLPSEMADAFRLIAKLSLSMGIRGSFTAEVLECLGITNYAVVGCPAWFEAGPDRIVAYPEFDRSKPVAATGLFSHPETDKIHFLLQDETLFLRSIFAGALPEPADAASLVGSYPHYGACAVAAFFAGRMQFHHDMRAWKMALSQRFSFAAGTRVHGAFAAMNAGLPALCTSGDARSAEMCALFKLPHRPGICAADLPLEHLYEMADPSGANSAYPKLYQNFVSWLEGLGIHSHDSFHEAPRWPLGAVELRPKLEQDGLLVSVLTSARERVEERAPGHSANEPVSRGDGNDAPVLSICIPTYNRVGHLEKLLRFLSANLLVNARFSIEVIVVNNASTDGTRSMLSGLDDDRLRVIHRDVHLPTAEENIFHSLNYCSGEFVWFLGDDDVPVLGNFEDHYALLKTAAYDFLLFNPAIADCRGSIAVLQNVKMNREMLALPIAGLVATFGCFFTLAGISNGIIRRRLLTTERGLHYMGVSQIYSMVAWMIDGAKGARCVFVNAPLVYYRENDYSDGHWSRVAARLGVGDHYFWSVGTVVLLRELIVQGALSPADVARIREVNRDGQRHNLIDDILYKYFLQLKAAASDDDPRQQISQEQLAAAACFFAEVDPTTFDLVSCLKRMASALGTFAALEQEFLQRFGERQACGVWLRAVRQIYKGYEILETPVQFTAIRQGFGLRDRVMETIDPLPQSPLVVVAPTWPELAAQIDGVATVAPVPVVACATAPPPLIQVISPPIAEEQARLAAISSEALGRLAAVYNSSSWQLTYPLRAARVLLSRIARTIFRRS